MTIDEAIKILSNSAPTFGISSKTDYQDAIKLGIEALKVIKYARKTGDIPKHIPLKGETKD